MEFCHIKLETKTSEYIWNLHTDSKEYQIGKKKNNKHQIQTNFISKWDPYSK